MYVQNSVGSLAIGGPLEEAGWVRTDILGPDIHELQSLNQTVLTNTVVALRTIVRHKPTAASTKGAKQQQVSTGTKQEIKQWIIKDLLML